MYACVRADTPGTLALLTQARTRCHNLQNCAPHLPTRNALPNMSRRSAGATPRHDWSSPHPYPWTRAMNSAGTAYLPRVLGQATCHG